MKHSLFLILSFCFVFCVSDKEDSNNPDERVIYDSYHQEALQYIQNSHFHTGFYVLIDLGIHSGKKRLFVYDFHSETIIDQAMVTHGACDVFEPNPKKYQEAKFNNQSDSHCSSEGKYRIGKRDYSSWGIHVKYWLHGMERTNDNAVKRVVVLHSWSAVSHNEVFPRYLPLSWGCPAVSDTFMHQLDEKLKAVNGKPVLLWIIKS